MCHSWRCRVLLGALIFVSCSCRLSLSFMMPTTTLRPSAAACRTADPTRVRRRSIKAGLLQRDGTSEVDIGASPSLLPSTAWRRNLRRTCMTTSTTGSEESTDGATTAARAATTASSSSDTLPTAKIAALPSKSVATPMTEETGMTGRHDKDEEEGAVALTLDRALEEGINRAMRGDAGVLRQVLASDVQWRGPLGQFIGLEAVNAELRGLGQLLSDPKISIFACNRRGGLELEWIASGTWPLPWLPRFIVKGKSIVDIGSDGKVVNMSDTWEGNVLGLALKHLVPGFWDLWHQLGSPPAEQMPYKVLKKTWGYEIREYAPRLVYQPSLIDRSNSRELRMALILPGFSHTGELRTSGRNPEEYFVTGPIEVAIQPIIEKGYFSNGTWFNGTVREASMSRRSNRITWTVPVPTAMGLDVSTLPPPAKGREKGGGQRSRHVRQGFRRIAAINFNGLPQDPEASEVRSKLLSSLAADGVTPNKGEDGRVRSGILMHNSRGCFNKAGQLSMSILYHRPKYIGIGNEVFVELDDEEAVTGACVWGDEGEEGEEGPTA